MSLAATLARVAELAEKAGNVTCTITPEGVLLRARSNATAARPEEFVSFADAEAGGEALFVTKLAELQAAISAAPGHRGYLLTGQS